MDYHKLNTATVNDPFPLPFTDMILDTVAGRLQPSKDGRGGPREDTFCNRMGGVCGRFHDVRIEERASHFPKDDNGNL